MSIQGPCADLPPKQYEAKKFLANTRLYVGNISPDVNESDVKEMFGEYGEIDEVFLNREKNFAFLKLDYRMSAERARAELDQKPVKGRPLKVRFAPANVRVKVKNLGPMVSNELLELAFGVFGEIEKALVFVDEKGRSLGEGFVDFTRKNNAQMAHKFCSDKCYFLTSELRPVITELSEMYEVDEGLLEANLPRREFNKNQENNYYKSREFGPRVAEAGTFESEFGEKWKTLIAEFKQKELGLKDEMQKEFDKLQAQMELERYDYETDMLRQQLRQREIDQERHKMEWETRMQRVPRNFVGGGGPGGGGGGFNGRMDEGQGQPPVNMEMPQDEPMAGMADMRGNSMPLAPPPMPPQALMSHLEGGEEGGQSGPTWVSPRAPHRFLYNCSHHSKPSSQFWRSNALAVCIR
jgi:proline- and glutamine-rich splicing factor